MWARPGQWPTKDGTEQTAPDNLFIKGDSLATNPDAQFRALDQTWYLMARGFNASGEAGPLATTTVLVQGTATTEAVLTRLTGAIDGDYHKITWEYPEEIENPTVGNAYTVEILQNGESVVTGRDPRNHPDGSIGYEGGYREFMGPQCTPDDGTAENPSRVASGGCTYQFYTYDVLLKNNGSEIGRYSTTLAGYYQE